MFVHTFGAYFGLAVSKVLTSSPGHGKPPRKYNSSIYKSDMFAMVGTLFLWMFWPSFNGALAEDAQQARVAINTVLALTASCFVAFMADVIFRKDHKFDMVSIQNATLAGGVAVGSSSDLVIQPWGALVVGAVAGLISVLGYVYISPMLSKIFFLDDTCGVHNLHGLPGIIGGLGGIISSVTASDSIYGQDISTVFAARGPCPEGVDKAMAKIPCGRSAAEQAEWQAYALITTLIIAVVGGLLTGLVVKAPFLVPNKKGETDRCTGFGNNGDDRLWYQDRHYWEQPEEEEDHDHHE